MAKTPEAPHRPVPPPIDPTTFLSRPSQVQWDHYYMEVAKTVQTRANCSGTKVGAVRVVGNRIVSTGFNGTPAGFPNCLDGGCVRCRDRELGEQGRYSEASDRNLARNRAKQLDLCICVHAEANAILSGARFGNRTEGACLYSTHSPCFSCLKETIQAGVERIVYLHPWSPSDSPSLARQYELLKEHLRGTDERNFEQLALQGEWLDEGAKSRAPDLDSEVLGIQAEAEKKAKAAERAEQRKKLKRREARAARQRSGKSGAAARTRS